VLIGNLFERQRLEVVGMQVRGDVLVVAGQQDVRVQPQRQREAGQRLAEEPELGPLGLLGSGIRAGAVGGQLLGEDGVPPPPREPLKGRQCQLLQDVPHLRTGRGDDRPAGSRRLRPPFTRG